MKRALALALGLLLTGAPALADIDNSAYEAGDALRDPGHRQRLESQFERDADAERRRAEAEAARAQEARELARAREAARPYPERLTEEQCTRCHGADNYTTKAHTWLAWRLVVARMVWLNDAPIPFEAQGLIADHLARAYPAAPGNEVVEFAYALAAILPILVAPWAFFLMLGRSNQPGPRPRRRRNGG